MTISGVMRIMHRWIPAFAGMTRKPNALQHGGHVAGAPIIW